MKKMLFLIAVFGLVSVGLFAGCKKEETAPAMPDVPSTNAPAMPAPAK
jgi:hypothetical protein